MVACEESQTVCKAFRERGHEAYSCDIQEPSGSHPEWHIKQDVLPLLNGFCEFNTMDGKYHMIFQKWDLLIAHPPCTYLSNAGAVRMRKNGEIVPERYALAMEAKAFFMAFYNADVPRIAVENPTPMKIVGLPPYTQAIQPYEYGHPYSKRTCLWLKGLPRLTPTEELEHYTPFVPSNTGAYSRGGGGGRGIARTPKERAKTFSGIAAAMADQWGSLSPTGQKG